MKLRLLLAGLSACSVVVLATAAHAAPAPSCTPASMLPRATSVPANLPGFAYTALDSTAKDVHLFAVDSGTEQPLSVGPVSEGAMKVVPTNPLIVGKSYRLEFNPFCSYGPVQPQAPITFTVAADAPLPTKLGTALATPTVTLKDYGTTRFSIATSMTLEPEITPWLSVYQLFVVLDGKPVATTITRNGETVGIVADGWCDGALAATKSHTLLLRGRLTYAPTVETLATDVSFNCPAPLIGTPKDPPPTPPEPGSTPTNPSQLGQPQTSIGQGGCSVSHGESGGSSLPILGVALGMLALVRRRVSAASAATRRT